MVLWTKMDCFLTTVNLGYCNGTIFCLQEYSQEQTNIPYFIDIQTDFLNHLSTRLVIPLARKQPTNSQVKVLSPVLTIDHVDYVIMTSLLTTTDVKNLSSDKPMMDARHLRDELIAAIDFLILGI
ncbi:cytotoxic protein [Yersinia intermedia]|uniref:CcdB family protein n=2 Tax=Yersinia intermedia TaxID=631 RepID=UPI0005E3FEC5|nr:CcdB family protein [Yersinia intermedia]CND13409.1 cytotoxic protein [Yersinia intermedia]CNH39147.1 cytotoxic protein [Yersinia intermedia]